MLARTLCFFISRACAKALMRALSMLANRDAESDEAEKAAPGSAVCELTIGRVDVL